MLAAERNSPGLFSPRGPSSFENYATFTRSHNQILIQNCVRWSALDVDDDDDDYDDDCDDDDDSDSDNDEAGPISLSRGLNEQQQSNDNSRLSREIPLATTLIRGRRRRQR